VQTEILDTDLAPSTPMVRARTAMAALRLIATHTPGTVLTADDRVTLLAWAGWGTLAPAFEAVPKGGWATIADELETLLDDDAMRSAIQQVDTSFFTPDLLVDSVYDILESVGFTGGRVLEPGCGTGRFMSRAPAGMAIDWTGVEIDPTSAAIASALHPAANIVVSPLERHPLVTGSFDAVVGNVPFSSANVYDAAFGTSSIHEYFIARGLDAVRPGGYVIILTSRFVMDSGDVPAKFGELGAELMGAVRLPSGAFTAEGTEVVVDMLIFRKPEAGDGISAVAAAHTELSTEYNSPSPLWIQEPSTDTVAHVRDTDVSWYWREFPQHVAGVMKVTSFYQNPLVVISDDRTGDITAAVDAVKLVLPAQGEPRDIALSLADVPLTDSTGRKEGSFHVVDGAVHEVIGGILTPVRNSVELRYLITFRDAAVALVELESDTALTDTAIAAVRDEAHRLYLAYVDKFGALNRGTLSEGKPDPDTGLPTFTWRRPALGGFRRDPDYSTVIAMEQFDQNDGTASPAPILLRRVNRRPAPVERVDTAGEALAVSLGETQTVELARISCLLGLDTEAEAQDALGELVFEDGGQLVAARDYLSGDVRSKLQSARIAATTNPALARNVVALESALPADLGPLEIRVTLGASWLSASDIEQFARAVLGSTATITHTPAVASWDVNWYKYGGGSYSSQMEFGTRRVDPMQLLDWALNGKAAVLYDEVWNPQTYSTKRVRNHAESLAASEKMKAIDDRFSTWIWEDAERAERVASVYNRLFNSHVARTADGSGLVFPGLAEEITPWTHQRDAVDRIVSSERALIGHPVGAGKTKSMILAAMTLRRFGLAQKPMIAVPNHLLDQIVREAQQAYPTAKFLIASKEDLTRERRKVFAARCATGDWDAVVITHQAFTSMPVAPEAEARWIESQKWELSNAMRDVPRYDNGRGPKAIARAMRSLEARLTELRSGVKDENQVLFEQLGVDYLMVDECFPFDTLIDTDQGQIQIGRIVDEALDVQIASVNLVTGETEYKPIHRWVRKENHENLVRITHEQGTFICTPNHPIWVEGVGYVPAGQIQASQALRVVLGSVDVAGGASPLLREAASVDGVESSTSRNSQMSVLREQLPTAKREADNVQPVLRRAATLRASTKTGIADLSAMQLTLREDGVSAEILQSQLRRVRVEGEAYSRTGEAAGDCLLAVQDSVLAEEPAVKVLHDVLSNSALCSGPVPRGDLLELQDHISAQPTSPAILRPDLRDGVKEYGPSGNRPSGPHAFGRATFLSFYGGERELLGADDATKPDAQPGDGSEDAVFASGADLLVSRWERSDDGSPKAFSGEAESPHGILYSDARGVGSVRIAAELVRRGSSVSGSETGDRGGRQNTSAEAMEIPGSAQDGGLGISRVVGVEVLERRSPLRHGESGQDDSLSHGVVYNLEVADNHNYFAAGVLVSNCHLFRRLATGSTSRDNGFGSSSSKRATDMLLKIEVLADKYPGKPIVSMFTGTPWANTLAETWVWQRYLQPEALVAAGVQQFDPWVATFVRYENTVEVAPDGSGFRIQRRPAGMKNLPELRTMLSRVADIVRPDDIGLERPDHTVHNIVVEAAPQQHEFVRGLAVRADAIRGAGKAERPDGRGDDSMLLVCNDGRAAALDPMLVGINEHSPKVAEVARELAKVYHANADNMYGNSEVAGAFHLVLLDLGTPHPGDTAVYGRLRQLLVMHGVPADEVRWIHEAKTDKARAALFAQCREGSVAILMGSTSKVGMGTNIQTRLKSLWHIDAPWTPAEVEQREGRALRPNNLNTHVDVYRCVTEGTFDAYTWQALERKARSFAALYDINSTAREVDDISGTALSYGEVKALAAGNPMLLEQAKTAASVQRLRLMRSVHLQNVNRAKQDSERESAQARACTSQAERLEQYVASNPGGRIEPSDTLVQLVEAIVKRDRLGYFRATHRGVTIRESSQPSPKRGWLVLVLESHYHPVGEVIVKPKTISGGAAGVLEQIVGSVDEFADGAEQKAAVQRRSAISATERSALADSAAETAVFDREDELQDAIAALARIDMEITTEAEEFHGVAA